MTNERMRIGPANGTWVVRAGGAVIGESARALELVEGDYDPVIYFPREDLAMAFLDPSETTTQCPHKGDARYFNISTQNGSLPDAAWSYETPKPEVEALSGHIAFYADRVTIEEV